MKRIIILTSLLIMAASCTSDKTLVAYFSATGTTKAVAEKIAEAAQADLFEIQPAVPYTDADLDWRNSLSRSSVEMSDKTSRPAVAGKVKNLNRYETIYIGFPIWWYTAPTIINTFIEENDLAGKRVKFFATSGGSGIKRAVDDFKEAYPAIGWAGGKLLNNPSEEDIRAFLSNEDKMEIRCGGYTEQHEIEDDELALFEKVAGSNELILTPITVATQVVAGLNYKFFCIYEGTETEAPGECWVTIYKPLEGEPQLSSIVKL